MSYKIIRLSHIPLFSKYFAPYTYYCRQFSMNDKQQEKEFVAYDVEYYLFYSKTN